MHLLPSLQTLPTCQLTVRCFCHSNLRAAQNCPLECFGASVGQCALFAPDRASCPPVPLPLVVSASAYNLASSPALVWQLEAWGQALMHRILSNIPPPCRRALYFQTTYPPSLEGDTEPLSPCGGTIPQCCHRVLSLLAGQICLN